MSHGETQPDRLIDFQDSLIRKGAYSIAQTSLVYRPDLVQQDFSLSAERSFTSHNQHLERIDPLQVP